ERAIDDEAGLAQRAHDRPEATDGFARTGRAHRHRMRIARRRHDDVKWPRPKTQQGEFGEMHVERPRLRLRKNRGGIAALHGTTLEHLAEGVDPFSFDAVGKHRILPALPTLRSFIPAASNLRKSRTANFEVPRKYQRFAETIVATPVTSAGRASDDLFIPHLV